MAAQGQGDGGGRHSPAERQAFLRNSISADSVLNTRLFLEIGPDAGDEVEKS